MTERRGVALAGLATGSLVWGLIWYPYRIMAGLGLSGLTATLFTYGIALALSLALLPAGWRGLQATPLLLAIALAAGGCNLGYVVAMLDGQVMRVLLLFYLSPLWTVILARLLLAERLNATGGAIVGLSLAGALVMLWRPEMGLPWPAHRSEWTGLGAGFLFALSNVLARRSQHISLETKSVVMFMGAGLVGLLVIAFDLAPLTMAVKDWPAVVLLAVVVGLTLLAVNMAVQHGLAQTPANDAVVILLGELVVAAIGAWLLAGEAMSPREYLGGAMIVAASLLSIRLGTAH